MEYPKINSLWKREGWYFDEEIKHSPEKQKGRQCFIIGDYACEEFAAINKWAVHEKVDGTNIRIFYQNGKITFGGRTKDAQIPTALFMYLQETFTESVLEKCFPIDTDGLKPSVILFGEGHGPKIQACGSKYSKNCGVKLFDMHINGWWLKKEDVYENAKKLEVPTAPFLGIMTTDEVIAYVKSKPLSLCSDQEQVMEGVICRPEPLMLFRNGRPIFWKLKCKEFP